MYWAGWSWEKKACRWKPRHCWFPLPFFSWLFSTKTILEQQSKSLLPKSMAVAVVFNAIWVLEVLTALCDTVLTTNAQFAVTMSNESADKLFKRYLASDAAMRWKCKGWKGIDLQRIHAEKCKTAGIRKLAVASLLRRGVMKSSVNKAHAARILHGLLER